MPSSHHSGSSASRNSYKSGSNASSRVKAAPSNVGSNCSSIRPCDSISNVSSRVSSSSHHSGSSRHSGSALGSGSGSRYSTTPRSLASGSHRSLPPLIEHAISGSGFDAADEDQVALGWELHDPERFGGRVSQAIRERYGHFYDPNSRDYRSGVPTNAMDTGSSRSDNRSAASASRYSGSRYDGGGENGDDCRSRVTSSSRRSGSGHGSYYGDHSEDELRLPSDYGRSVARSSTSRHSGSSRGFANTEY